MDLCTGKEWISWEETVNEVIPAVDNDDDTTEDLTAPDASADESKATLTGITIHISTVLILMISI